MATAPSNLNSAEGIKYLQSLQGVPVAAPVVAPVPGQPMPVAAVPGIPAAAPVAANGGLYQYTNNPTVYRAGDNYAFSSWDELTKAYGANPQIETRPNVGAYKYDDSPTVYRSDTNAPFSSGQEFLASGGNFGTVETRQRPDANRDLAEAAARAGMDPAALQAIFENQGAATPEEKNKILNDLGIPALEEKAFAPTQSTLDIYNKAYAEAGLTDLKAKMTDLDKQIAAKRQAYTDASATENENPWLSEASRVGRLGRLADKANADIGNLTQQYGNYETQYNDALSHVDRVTSLQADDLQNNAALNKDKLNYLLSKAESQTKDLSSRGDALLARYLPDYLKAAEGEATKKQTTTLVTDLIGKYPDAGILETDSLTQASAKLPNSRIYQEAVRPPQSSGGSGSGALASTPIIDRGTDAGVRAIIQANISSDPKKGGYGSAYEAVKAKYGEAVAKSYDTVYQDVFNKGASVDAAMNNAKLAAPQTTPAQISTTVNQIAGAFDNEPIVKQYNTIAETVRAVQTAGKTPTDDIQRIYAFAKVMDPNSAVREGEYKTVQDYSATLLQRSGLKAKRVFQNDGFLTEEARKFITDTLNNRLSASQSSYNTLYQQYQKRLQDAQSGKGNSITDYSQSNSSPLEGYTSSGLKYTITQQ